MSTFVRNLTIALVALTLVAGIFAESFLSIISTQVPNTTELRWSLIVGMPIVLFVSYTWLNQQPAKTAVAAVLQSVGLLALFLTPYWWVVRHAQ